MRYLEVSPWFLNLQTKRGGFRATRHGEVRYKDICENTTHKKANWGEVTALNQYESDLSALLLVILQLYEVGETDDGAPTITIHVPRSEASGYINNKKENYSFRSAVRGSKMCYTLASNPGSLSGGLLTFEARYMYTHVHCAA